MNLIFNLIWAWIQEQERQQLSYKNGLKPYEA